jgi:flagellar motor protein MotB
MFLLGEGVPAERVHGAGFGEARPVASSADAEGRANNCRVEIIMGRRTSEDVAASTCPIR